MPAWARLGSGHGDEGRVARRVRPVALGPAGLQGGIPLSVGLLTPSEIDLMLRSLPVDVTFVDENDEVRYFFPRT